MPRFYFDVYNGRTHRDDVGIECADLAMARREAIRASGEVVSEKTEIDVINPWKMVVRDECNVAVARRKFERSL